VHVPGFDAWIKATKVTVLLIWMKVFFSFDTVVKSAFSGFDDNDKA